MGGDFQAAASDDYTFNGEKTKYIPRPYLLNISCTTPTSSFSLPQELPHGSSQMCVVAPKVSSHTCQPSLHSCWHQFRMISLSSYTGEDGIIITSIPQLQTVEWTEWFLLPKVWTRGHIVTKKGFILHLWEEVFLRVHSNLYSWSCYHWWF